VNEFFLVKAIDVSAILSQLRLIDGKRLYQKIGVIGELDYKKLVDKIVMLCDNNTKRNHETSEATP